MRRALLVFGMGLLALAPPAHADVPLSFVGLYDEGTAGLADQARLGVGIVRQPFDWSRVEESGWSAYDDYVARAATAGVSVLPILVRRPELGPPSSRAAYAEFVGAAVHRYGPTGSFWIEHPDVPFLPVHAWQVWNEPNIPNWWRGGVSSRSYVRLLRAGAQAIRAADPGAEVVAAGLPNSKLGVPFLDYLDQMYRAGARGVFDTLAIHPYSRDVGGVLALAERARVVMNRWHDRARLWITEFGWSTGGGASKFRVSERGQADRIAGSLSALIAERRALRLRGFIFFRWQDAVAPPELGRDPWPLHTGLLEADGTPKPGFGAFARVVEALRDGDAGGGSAEPARIARRDVRLSPLGFAAVTLRCRSDAPGACGGVLRLRSSRGVLCGGRRLAAGSKLGAVPFRIAAAPAIAPVRIRSAARRVARCAGRIRARATVAPADRAHAAAAHWVEFEIRSG
ncbi:MAG TPA: hypothetical protein VF066_01655 [Thermoleophilaceae bacterium]